MIMIVDRVIKVVINLIFEFAEAFDNSINLNATLNDRQKQRRCSVRKCVLQNFAKFTGKHLGQILFSNKVVFLKK